MWTITVIVVAHCSFIQPTTKTKTPSLSLSSTAGLPQSQAAPRSLKNCIVSGGVQRALDSPLCDTDNIFSLNTHFSVYLFYAFCFEVEVVEVAEKNKRKKIVVDVIKRKIQQWNGWKLYSTVAAGLLGSFRFSPSSVMQCSKLAPESS